MLSAAAAVLAEAERDLDLDLRILHRGRDFRLVGWIAHAAAGDADATVWAKQLVTAPTLSFGMASGMSFDLAAPRRNDGCDAVG